jgi:hypothetical protein
MNPSASNWLIDRDAGSSTVSSPVALPLSPASSLKAASTTASSETADDRSSPQLHGSLVPIVAYINHPILNARRTDRTSRQASTSDQLALAST